MTNPFKHLLSHCRDQNRLATDAVEFFDSAPFLDGLKDGILAAKSVI